MARHATATAPPRTRTPPGRNVRPGTLALTITQGATFRRVFVWRAPDDNGTLIGVDLTGWTARAQIRVRGRPVLTFDTDPAADADGTITLDTDGRIELACPADVVSAAPATRSSGAWSLEVQAPDGGDRDVLLVGTVTIVAEVTK